MTSRGFFTKIWVKEKNTENDVLTIIYMIEIKQWNTIAWIVEQDKPTGPFTIYDAIIQLNDW